MKRIGKYKRTLVTGGSGFIGCSLALDLKKSAPKAHIIVLDNLIRRGSELNVPRLKAKGIEFHHGDIRNPEDLKQFNAIDLILECSAEPSVLANAWWSQSERNIPIVSPAPTKTIKKNIGAVIANSPITAAFS